MAGKRTILEDVSTNTDMSRDWPFSQTLRRLREVGLRPTRQRLALGKLLLTR